MRIEFGTADSSQFLTQPVAPVAPKKRGWLPLLVVLFLISYALMTMLIVEQGQTIESQRTLIRELFQDSTELSASRMKAQAERGKKTANQTPQTQNKSQARTQTPSTQDPSTQAQNKQAPSSQADVQHHAQSQKPPKAQRQMPAQPAADLGDARRSLITI